MLPPPHLPAPRAIRDLRLDGSHAPGGPNYERVVTEHLPMVHGMAHRLLADLPSAVDDVTLAVFEAFTLRWKTLSRPTVIASWLARTTLLAAKRARKQFAAPRPAKGSEVALNWKLLSIFDRGLKLREKDALLLRHTLGDSEESAARTLKLNPRAVQRAAAKGEQRLERPLRKHGHAGGPEAWLQGLALAPGDQLAFDAVQAARHWKPLAPRAPLAAAALSSWRWLGVRRFFGAVAKGLGVVVCCLFALGLTFKYLADNGYLMQFAMRHQGRDFANRFPGIMEPAKPFPISPEEQALVRTAPPATAAELYTFTNIWPVKLTFTEEQWEKITPSRIKPYSEPGRLALRNPNAKRNGLAGVVGIEFNWTEGNFEIAGQTFTNVAVRYRGNGTWLNAQHTPKRSFKVDLNKHVKGQKLVGVDELNFLNSIADFSFMHDALAERFFRDLGVPGPRTAYAYLTVDAPGTFTNQPLGLYVMVEDLNDDYAKDRFGSKKIPIFKPVTRELFADLGSDWKAYEGIYDVKTEITPAQQQRVIEFARLVSHGSDEEFAAQFASFVDVEEFASFVAGHVLLSAYDGFLANGQNYYMYLGEDNRFGFISWDQDHSWGEFGYVGNTEKREQASIWQPASYNNRFLDRALKVEAFRKAYQAKLEHALERYFTTENLYPQIDALAAVIRPAVAAENPFRLQRFDICVSSEFYDGPRDSGAQEGPGKPAHQIKRFIANRIASVRAQLDGQSEGVALRRGH